MILRDLFKCLYPSYQKILLDAGFIPRGYIPRWMYNQEKNCFENHVFFNYFERNISDKVQLIEDGKELIKILRFPE